MALHPTGSKSWSHEDGRRTEHEPGPAKPGRRVATLVHSGSTVTDGSFRKSTSSPRTKALFCTAVWGKDYVERFLKYSLRTQLADGNIGAFDPRSKFLIITREEDFDQVITSDAFQTLSQLVTAECVCFPPPAKSESKYSTLAHYQHYALQRSFDFDVIFFGYADALWANGSYRAAAERLDQGYDAVFAPGYPVVEKGFREAIEDDCRADDFRPLAIPPRQFAKYVHQNLHAMFVANEWHGEHLSSCPSYVVWQVPEQGALMRAFHLHPVALRVQRDAPDFFGPFQTSLDEDFVARLYRTNPRAYVCKSSDEIAVCSLVGAGDGSYLHEPRRRPNLFDLTVFAEAHAGLMHRTLFRQSTRLVIDDVVEERWQEAEREAADLATDIGMRLSTPDSLLAVEAPVAYAARVRRLRTYGDLHLFLDPPTHRPFRPRVRIRNRLAFATLRTLYVLRITRLFKILVFSRLGPENQQRIVQAVHEVGTKKGLSIALRRLYPTDTPPGFVAALFRWLKSWFVA